MGSWRNPTPQIRLLDKCQIFGSIYLTSKAAEADFVVFEESEETFANLVVYKETILSYANEPGKWYFVDDPRLADYYIFIAPNIAQADFTVAFTDVESFAGCND